MTRDKDQEITRTQAVQRLAQVIAHDAGASDELRQQARDTAVSAHTVLQRLRGQE
jgi:hypothetical protein